MAARTHDLKDDGPPSQGSFGRRTESLLRHEGPRRRTREVRPGRGGPILTQSAVRATLDDRHLCQPGRVDDGFDRFRERYERPHEAVLDVIEQAVVGTVYGANGYTTLDQVELIADRLELGSDDLLLDVGTGCGWPGLHLATMTGCRVVATDAPFDGLTRAARRAAEDGIDGMVDVVAATGQQPPFRSRTFDAICSTDVLC